MSKTNDEKQAEKQAQAAQDVGLADHRPLTTGDLAAIAAYTKAVNAPQKSSGSRKTAAKKEGDKS